MRKEENKNLVEDMKKFSKEICGGTLLFGIVVSLFLLLFCNLAISKGFLLGTCFSIFNFILLTISSSFSWGKGRKQATGVYSISLFIRYIILGIPIVIAMQSSRFDLISTIVGIFSIQIFIFTYYTIIPVIEKRLSLLGE